nr:MAG TPA: hypothetical protein [Caudoviricetes sp.]
MHLCAFVLYLCAIPISYISVSFHVVKKVSIPLDFHLQHAILRVQRDLHI